MTSEALCVLQAGDPAGRAEWLRRWTAWPSREPMAHPTYVELFSRPSDRVICLASGSDAAGVLFPVILRPLAVERWAKPGEQRWDATTPYGYGGPFSWGRPIQHQGGFWERAMTWLAENRVVTLFLRLSLFPEDVREYQGEAITVQQNVVRSLAISSEAMWRDYAHKVRKNVGTARRAGLLVEFDHDGARLDDFLTIYSSTMTRRGAASGYRFSRDFFQRIVREMQGAFTFAHVMDGEKVVSTELVLRSSRRLYSFLGGTLSDAFDKRPNDLLKHEVAEWGRREGLSDFVLGGGYGSDDGIFQYKRSFAPQGAVPFHVGQVTLNATAVTELVERRKIHEAEQSSSWQPQPFYFPPYRA